MASFFVPSTPSVSVRMTFSGWRWEVWSGDGKLLEDGWGKSSRQARKEGEDWIRLSWKPRQRAHPAVVSA